MLDGCCIFSIKDKCYADYSQSVLFSQFLKRNLQLSLVREAKINTKLHPQEGASCQRTQNEIISIARFSLVRRGKVVAS